MSDHSNAKLWPFGAKTAILVALPILIGMLILVAILRITTGWPPAESDNLVLAGIAAIAAFPVALALVDKLIDGRAVIKYGDLSLDLSGAAAVVPSTVSVPTNIGVVGRAVTDSDTAEILDSLRKAAGTDIVIIDLGDGVDWWETRLLILLAGAVRRRKPSVVVFVAKVGDVDGVFQGWATPDALFPLVLRQDHRYRQCYHAAMAAAAQWLLVEPAIPAGSPPPAQPPHAVMPVALLWFQFLASAHPFIAFDSATGLPNEFAAEQFLALKLGQDIEMLAPLPVNLARLEIYLPVLHQAAIEENALREKQMEDFFAASGPYVAVTKERQYQRLLSKVAGLNAIVKSIVGGNSKT